MLPTSWRAPFFALAILLSSLLLNAQSSSNPATSNVPTNLLYPGEEKHLHNVRQLTFGGQNAEAYFSIDDKILSFQHQGQGVPCDRALHSRLDRFSAASG